MRAIAIAGVVFACVFGSALFGLFLRGMLPEHHLSSESKDVVKLAMGLIATMAAPAVLDQSPIDPISSVSLD